MPHYKVRYKTDADQDRRIWPIGPVPNREYALALFNNGDARIAGIGPFTFDETSPVLPLYNLVEQQVANAPEVMYPLYDCDVPAGAQR